MSQMPLVDAIKAHLSEKKQQWHTPGHGPNLPLDGSWLNWAYDLTEVGALSPTNDRTDPISQSMRRMAEIFGVKRSWYSVQGASLPVTAAILAATSRRGTSVVIERTCHRSALSALIIGGLEPHWIYPAQPFHGASPNQIIEALTPNTAALILTRPTYDGVASDIGSVVEAAHRLSVPVVVDEAHGTHWYGRQGYPTSALELGADLVAHGAHKTEPVLTQAGLLHAQGDLIAMGDVDLWWDLLSTSSPSYLLMSSLDAYQALRRDQGWTSRWEMMALQTRELWHRFSEINILQAQIEKRADGTQADPAKMTLIGNGSQIREAVERWGWAEKTEPGAVTLIFSPTGKLSVVHSMLSTLKYLAVTSAPKHLVMPKPIVQLTPREAFMHNPPVSVDLKNAVGNIAHRALVPYPPGIPLVQPGEEITEDVVNWVEAWQTLHAGFIEGLDAADGGRGGWVWVVK
ncbi:MAG: PLP-dependent transferase [Firmicutes bacterium]|nr:PLP-dependent transferase [Bacillota bacterium]MCL5971999.1 PLP-dependent transferase [Bacillota bacterium]